MVGNPFNASAAPEPLDMGHLISVVFQVVRRNLVLFIAILFVLYAATWARTEWRTLHEVISEIPALERSHDAVDRYRSEASVNGTSRINQFRSAGVAALDARLASLELEIASARRESVKASMPAVLLKKDGSWEAALVRAAEQRVQLALLLQEKQYLTSLRDHAAAILDRKSAVEEVARLEARSASARASLRAALVTQANRKKAQPLTRWLHVFANKEEDALIEKLTRNAAAADADYAAKTKLLESLPSLTLPGAFSVDQRQLAEAVAPLRDRLEAARSLASENRIIRFYRTMQPLLVGAGLVLLSSWLVPAAIRALFYFVLAPAASRRPPVIIGMPNGSAVFSLAKRLPDGGDSALISAVSRRVTLEPTQEMLLRADHLQSQAAGLTIRTKVLFSWQYILPSIASHLWLLNRIQADRATEIVVSSTADPLEEIALLEIAPGESFILQSRSLVGIVHETGRRPRIRSHWRLGTAHAWLTLQLRYLAFEGPATLIVKGCRGVRLESADQGRAISQDATIGFSGNAAYSTTRTDPFFPYLRGKQALLNDRFAGSDAYYLYEEIPRRARPGHQKNNPFELFIDAGLKAFGI